MTDIRDELAALAQHLSSRREAILQSWQIAVRKDPELTSGDALPRGQLFDHIPAILTTFERELHTPAGACGGRRKRCRPGARGGAWIAALEAGL